MAADTALDLGYSLHAVLPGSRIAVEDDIQRQCEPGRSKDQHQMDGVKLYRELLAKAARVLELDPPSGSIDSTEFTDESYAQAGSVILDHSDIVIIAVHEKGTDHPGGTKWMEQRCEELDLPMIRVPIDQPSQAIIVWTKDGRRENRLLFNAMSEGLNSSVFDSALNEVLLHQSSTSNPYRTGWFENRLINQLDPDFNLQFWDKRWTLPGIARALSEHSLGSVTKEIDDDLKAVKVWADHRASAMANMVRGSFIFCSILGSLAVCGAVLGLLLPSYAKAGKILELGCLTIVLCFIKRSTKWNWRAQWLSLRQLERSIEQSAWLLLLGRIPPFASSLHTRDFQDDSHNLWANWYLRSVLRAASFPNAQLDVDYIKTVQELASENLIRNQIDYFESEAASFHNADEKLETYIKRCIFLAFLVTFGYLGTHYFIVLSDHFNILPGVRDLLHTVANKIPVLGSPITTALGATMPAIAAALSAIRSHGEYAEIAARYQGTSATLRQIEKQVARMQPDGRQGHRTTPLRGAEVTEILRAVTNTLFQEVVGWRSILRRKEIEPI